MVSYGVGNLARKLNWRKKWRSLGRCVIRFIFLPPLFVQLHLLYILLPSFDGIFLPVLSFLFCFPVIAPNYGLFADSVALENWCLIPILQHKIKIKTWHLGYLDDWKNIFELCYLLFREITCPCVSVSCRIRVWCPYPCFLTHHEESNFVETQQKHNLMTWRCPQLVI